MHQTKERPRWPQHRPSRPTVDWARPDKRGLQFWAFAADTRWVNDGGRSPQHGGPGRPELNASLERVDHQGLIERIDQARAIPPVGLVLIGWNPPTDGYGPSDRLVEQSVIFSVAASGRADDTIVAAAAAEVAIIRSAMDAPAAAEGLAHRLAQRLETELERLAVELGEPRASWAIGVAVARPEDRSTDLARYAHSALDDAWMLGGHRMVAFDDGDRELFNPPDPG